MHLKSKLRKRNGNAQPFSPIGNYAFFGSASPRRGAGVVTATFPVVACCNAFPPPSARRCEGSGATYSQTQIRRALVRCMRLAVMMTCSNFVSNSAWPYPLTPLVIMLRKSSRARNQRAGIPTSGFHSGAVCRSPERTCPRPAAALAMAFIGSSRCVPRATVVCDGAVNNLGRVIMPHDYHRHLPLSMVCSGSLRPRSSGESRR